jgi:hypothetical protein
MWHGRRWVVVAMAAVGAGLWPGTRALAAADWNACAMLQQADVEAAFAPRKFGPGTLEREIVKSTGSMATLSTCNFTSLEASSKDRLSVSLLARRAPSDTTGTTPAAARAGAVQLKATPVDVPGLGDGAYWVNMGSSAFPSVQLNVFRGKRVWLIYSASGRRLDTAAAVAGLTRAATAAAAR